MASSFTTTLALEESKSATTTATTATTSTTTTANTCTVVKNGVDRTSDFVTVSDETYANNANAVVHVLVTAVNCTGVHLCDQAVIQGCDRVVCDGKEACHNATILDFTNKVLCSGPHACQRAFIAAASAKVAMTTTGGYFPPSVVCAGQGSCDVATITNNNNQKVSGSTESSTTESTPTSQPHGVDVLCMGSKACRRAKITVGDGTVTCGEGSSQYHACLGNVQITAKCLLCEDDRGCKPYINECLYRNSSPLSDGQAQICVGRMGECGSSSSAAYTGISDDSESGDDSDESPGVQHYKGEEEGIITVQKKEEEEEEETKQQQVVEEGEP
jgi:hypothetical protein